MDTITVSRPLTTPSNLERRKRCPGSAKMEAGMPDNPGTPAWRGKFFHSYWAHPNWSRELLTPDDRDLLNRADQLNADVLDVIGYETDGRVTVEETLTGVNGRLTGTPDRVHIWHEHKAGLVTDLKSGFGIVEHAELNMQARGYAVLVNDNHAGLDKVYVSILQPRLWSPSERVTLAVYMPEDYRQAETEIDRIIDATEQPDAPLVAGEVQCRYCRAKLICPAFRKAVKMPLRKFKTERELSVARREAVIKKRVKGCNDTQLEVLYRAVKLALDVKEDVFDECRERIRRGEFQNFTLGKESEARTVTNVRRAIALLALSDVATREELLDMCTMPLHTLEEQYRNKHKRMTWQQARDRIRKILASVTTTEPRQPRILEKRRRLKK